MPLSPLPSQRGPSFIRTYRPVTDYPQVVEICKKVYNGNDALPLMIKNQVQEPGTQIFVHSQTEDAPIDALICCQERGSAAFVWGARVAEARRGQGLAKALLRRVEEFVASQPARVNAVLSTTILDNKAMRHIFNAGGYHQQCQIECWPSWHAYRQLAIHESALSIGEASLISLLPGLAELLRNSALPAAELRPLWRTCSSPEDLEAALVELRRARLMQKPCAAAANSVPEGAAHSAFAWLPAECILWPVRSEYVAHSLENQRIWKLDASEYGVRAVIFLSEGQWGAPIAGVVTDSRAGLEAAILKVCDLDTSCFKFYVDTCDAFAHAELFALGGGSHDYVVVHKMIAATATTEEEQG